MRKRTSFVSNSSSSSFIVASDTEETVITITLTLSLKEIAEDVVITIEELNKVFLDRYSWKDISLEEMLKADKYLDKKYKKCVAALDVGKTVIFGNVASSGCNELSQIIYYRGLPESAEYEIISNVG